MRALEHETFEQFLNTVIYALLVIMVSLGVSSSIWGSGNKVALVSTLFLGEVQTTILTSSAFTSTSGSWLLR